MKKIALLAAFLLLSPFVRADAQSDCAAQAVGSNGKPLAGAARASFMKKCMAEATAKEHAECEAKAVDKNGRPLAGAARASFMKKCVAEATAAKK